jgi:hypothetical protein
MRWYTSLVVMAFFLLVSGAYAADLGSCFQGGCDVIWKLNRNFDDGVRSKSASLVGPAKQAFDDSMRLLFQQQIGPTIERVNAMAAGRIDQFSDVIQKTQDGMRLLIDQAGSVAVASSEQAAITIEQHIIDATSTQAKQVIDKINDDLNTILAVIDCQVKDFQLWLKTQFIIIPKPFNHCYVDAGFSLSVPGSDDYFSIYKIRRCEMKDALILSKSVDEILDNYARLSLLAHRFSCVVAGSPESLQRIQGDEKEIAQKFAIWTLVSQ